ncbi:MAG: hypothetical protein HY558_01765 [Euryarchaeota archaeon]|nr:hypothetical protein [Euryarchaeota archaeon]
MGLLQRGWRKNRLEGDLDGRKAMRWLSQRKPVVVVDGFPRIVSRRVRKCLLRVLNSGRASSLMEAIEFARDYHEVTGRLP